MKKKLFPLLRPPEISFNLWVNMALNDQFSCSAPTGNMKNCTVLNEISVIDII